MRYGHGLIVGEFYPPHAGHHALIDAAAATCERVTVVVAPSSAESLPLELRLEWLPMARALARHYRLRGGVWAATRWVPEYGKELTERKLGKLRETRPEATVFDRGAVRGRRAA